MYADFDSFNTYIHDKDMIPYLLEYNWTCTKNGTWTNCPYPTYCAIRKKHSHTGNATPYLVGEMS